MGRNSENGITIKTVAEKAGISISTVSRVLNKPESVKPEKRNRVLEVIRELNYVPNPVARALGRSQIDSIAVVVPNIINSCMTEMVRGLIEELDESNYDAILFNTNESFEREERFFKALPRKMINGAVFIAGSGEDLDFGRLSTIMPVSIVERPEDIPGVDKFNVDDKQGIHRLVTYLMDLGHREIGMLAGSLNTKSGQSRVKDFQAALEREGLSWNPEQTVFCEWSMTGGYDGLSRLLSRGNCPTALICASDIIALGALGAAAEKGVRIPEDLSITGYDNSPDSAHAIPPLTTLSYPNYRLGRQAARAVLRRMKDPKAPDIHKIIPMELIERASCSKAGLRPEKTERRKKCL